jgi:hypothetical protein
MCTVNEIIVNIKIVMCTVNEIILNINIVMCTVNDILAPSGTIKHFKFIIFTF